MDSTEEKREDLLLIYKLVPKEDGTVQVTLSQAHRDFLTYIASRGGETRMNWDKAERMRNTPPHLRRETIKAHMGKLVEMRILDEIPVVGTSDSYLRLTDMGRNIVSQLLAQ